MSESAISAGSETALQAARRMVVERGYIVMGIRASCPRRIRPGDWATEWAGAALGGWWIVCEKETDRADWDAQALQIGDACQNDNPVERGQQFWRCRLVGPYGFFSGREETAGNDVRLKASGEGWSNHQQKQPG